MQDSDKGPNSRPLSVSAPEPPEVLPPEPSIVDDDEVTLSDLAGKGKAQPLWWRRRRLFIPFISGAVLLAILLAGAAVIVRSRQPYLTMAKVTQGNLSISLTTSGTVRSANYAADFTATGQVAQILVTVGQQVTAGQTLASLDTTLLKDAVAQAQAKADGASASLSSAKTNQNRVNAQASAMEDAAYAKEQNAIYQCKQTKSSPPNCVSQAENEYAAALAQADALRSSAQQQVDAAQAAYDTARADLQTAQDSLATGTLKAPHAGTVSAINGAIGQTTGTARSDGKPFIEIADLNALQVQAMVSETQVGTIRPRDTVRFTVPTLKNQVFNGTVSGVSPSGQPSDGLTLYPVTIDVDTQALSAQVKPLPGMAANVTIITAARFAVKLIPASAVTFAHDASTAKYGNLISKKAAANALSEAQQLQTAQQNRGVDLTEDRPVLGYVVVKEKGAWVTEPVLLGLTDGKYYEVLAGLDTGARVATGEELNWITILRNR